MFRCNFMLVSRLLVQDGIFQRIPVVTVTAKISSRTLISRPSYLSVSVSCNRTYRTNVSYNIAGLSKSLLSTSAVNVKSFSISDTKSDVKLGKDKVKERENQMKKLQDDGSPQVLLIDNEGKFMNTTLKQAEKIAKRRDLNIVKVEDPAITGKARKEVYKLITGKEYHEISRAEKESKPASGIKGEKALAINGGIAPNDLKAKLQNIEKWLKKGFQIKVTLAAKGLSKEVVESVYMKIEEEAAIMKARILQRREKHGDIKFYITPPKQEKKRVKKKVNEVVASSENSDVTQEKQDISEK